MPTDALPRGADPSREHGPAGDPYLPYRPVPPRFTLDRVVRFMLGAAVAALVLWGIWFFASLVVFLVVGVVFAYLMRPIVDRLQGLGIGRVPAILATFVIVFGGISILLTWLVPFAGIQLSELSQQIAFEKAAEITAVAPGSQAERIDLRVGDVVVGVDGQAWQGLSQVQTRLRGKQPGDVVRLVIENEEGMRRTVLLPVTTDAAGGVVPSPARGEEVRPERDVPGLGLTLQEVTVSEVASSIERRLRELMPVPVEKGSIFKGVTGALEAVFQEERITALASSVVGIFTDIFYAVLVIPFVAFFVLKDGTQMRRQILRLVPNRYFELTLAITENVETNIGRYFRALFLQSISVAAVATTLLYFVGLNYALAVGLFAGMANTIPYFGPLMGFLAGTLVGIAQTGDFSLVLGVLVAMGITQVSDNALFQPFIFSRAAQAHPLMILFVVLIGARLAGLVGMLIAIPVTTIIRVIVRQVLWGLRNYRILRTG